jgi:hypothetical protein
VNITNAITTIDLAGVRVVFHCPHEDGTAAYRVEHDNEHVTVYLTGTVEQLGVFADAVAKVAAERAITEVEQAMRTLERNEGPLHVRIDGTQRWCFVCRGWITDHATHAHAERTDPWHPATTAELMQRDRATFTTSPTTRP